MISFVVWITQFRNDVGKLSETAKLVCDRNLPEPVTTDSYQLGNYFRQNCDDLDNSQRVMFREVYRLYKEKIQGWEDVK